MKNTLIAFLFFCLTFPLFAAEVINSGATNPVAPYGDYINFGTKIGSAGYGFRTNSGTIEVKNLSGSWAIVGSGTGDVVGPSSSVDSEIAIYNSTTGKLLKRFAGTGVLTATSGVIGTATTTGTGAVVLATSPTVQTPTVSDGAIFNLLSNNNITIDASTNPRTVTTGVVRINHTPGMVGTRPFTLNIDAAGFGDTHAVSTDFTATGIGAGEQSHLFDINVNTANSTGGEVNGFTMAKTGTGAVDCNAVEVYPGVNVIIQRTGIETSIEQAFSYNGAYTDITSNLSSAASDVQLFVANGDIVYIGNAGTFNSLAVTLAVAASGAGIKPTFEYSAGASAWTAFSPTDGTNGFRNLGGTIAWGTLTGWATDTVNAVGSKYWVRITRTQNTLATPPTEDLVKYISSVNYGWDKDGDISAATLGLGTTTPATALHVVGTVTATGFAGNGAGLTAITATTNANLTGHVTSTGNAAVLGTFTSADLAGALSDETGSGASVFGTSPTFTTQITTPSIVSAGALGITPASGSNVNVNLAGTGDFAVNTNQLYVDTSTGNVGIGTSTPGTLLDVNGMSRFDNTLQVIGGANVPTGGAGLEFAGGVGGGGLTAFNRTTGTYLSLQNNALSYSFLTSGAEKVSILNNGNIGIGTSTPSAQLHTTGTVRFQNFGAGSATFDSAGNVSSASDERLKDVAGEFTVGLNQILGINPIRYHWNALSGLDKDNLYTGFSAQNVRRFIPEAVSVDSRGYYNLQDRALIAALVNAVKQLTAEIDELRSTAGLSLKSRIGVDRQADSGSVVKSKIAQIEKECGVDEMVKETKEVIENVDGIDVVKIVEVLKAGIVEKDKRFYRQESIEEATQRYRLTSQEQEAVK